MAGCSQNTEGLNEVEVTGITAGETEQPQNEEKKKETAMPVTKLDIENYNLEYKENTDAQPFFGWSNVAKTENGYYLWGSGNYLSYLMFFDPKTQKSVPVCNLPNCSHSDDNCNAYYPMGELEKDDIWKYGLWYYDNYIYMIGYDTDDYVNLYRTKLDGSSREKYMQLYKADTTPSENDGAKEYSIPELIIHRGYVYYIDKKEKKPKLKRMKLGGKETEILYETDGTYETDGNKPELNRIKGYGDYIFFQRSSVFGKEHKELEGLYAYNIQTRGITFVSNSIERDFTIFENEIYYCMEKELHKFSIQTQEDEKLMDYPKGITQVSVDRNYITLLSTKDNKIQIYDRKLNLLYDDMGDEETGILECYKGDENFFFAQFDVEKGRIRKLDKSKLKDKTAQWEVMY